MLRGLASNRQLRRCVKTNENACPRCGCNHIKKNGTTARGKPRYRCKECGKQFLFALDYSYRAYVPLLRGLIIPMTLNGSGIRDTARVLEISPNTVLEVLRQCAHQTPEPTLSTSISDLEMDEQWSFVQRKKQQNWLWYALDRHSSEIAAFVLGRITDAS